MEPDSWVVASRRSALRSDRNPCIDPPTSSAAIAITTMTSIRVKPCIVDRGAVMARALLIATSGAPLLPGVDVVGGAVRLVRPCRADVGALGILLARAAQGE